MISKTTKINVFNVETKKEDVISLHTENNTPVKIGYVIKPAKVTFQSCLDDGLFKSESVKFWTARSEIKHVCGSLRGLDLALETFNCAVVHRDADKSDVWTQVEMVSFSLRKVIVLPEPEEVPLTFRVDNPDELHQSRRVVERLIDKCLDSTITKRLDRDISVAEHPNYSLFGALATTLVVLLFCGGLHFALRSFKMEPYIQSKWIPFLSFHDTIYLSMFFLHFVLICYNSFYNRQTYSRFSEPLERVHTISNLFRIDRASILALYLVCLAVKLGIVRNLQLKPEVEEGAVFWVWMQAISLVSIFVFSISDLAVHGNLHNFGVALTVISSICVDIILEAPDGVPLFFEKCILALVFVTLNSRIDLERFSKSSTEKMHSCRPKACSIPVMRTYIQSFIFSVELCLLTMTIWVSASGAPIVEIPVITTPTPSPWSEIAQEFVISKIYK